MGSDPRDGDRVVISGMSGLYPRSHHVQDLCNILYNKVDPISSEGRHWQYSHPEVPLRVGSVPQLDRFDAQFFGVHFRLGNSMDTMSRKILEQTYQAIYDAGLSPEHLSGKKVGVYIGTCFSETEKAAFYVASSRTGFGIAGCSKAMFANRISYWLNAKGPSVAIDEACCSSTVALEQAYLALTRGDCEAAIVGGANISLHPQSLVHYGRILKLCMDGKTKSFDENADGCAKSEAINVLFLQKARDAMRIYADVLHVKTEFLSEEDESGPRFGFYRDPMKVGHFLKTFYAEAGISPQSVEYVEAFGSAVPEDDKAELEAISEVFCQKRDDPLLVGSVMSNIGYAEAATGISAITKVLLGYHKGEMAANLHCSSPRRDVPALQDGRIRIVTEHQPFRRGFAAVNSLSVTGCNGHVLLHGRYKPKDPSKYKTSIPYLVTISGRQETAVQNILDNLKSRQIDPEELALLHNIHKMKINGHLGRGYTILDTDPEQKTVSLAEACEYFDEARRPLWFVYSGMGSQWPGMGAQLMRIPVFAAAIDRCQKALDSTGLDIIHIITTPEKTVFNNILHSFVGIAAVQIGLTDVMRELGLVPDKIIGHSVGELGCAYADGCITAEEMILAAYSRGLVSVQTPLIHGSMAAVGIGYQQIVNMVPPEIEVACHNSAGSSTISGPSEVMKEFVESLSAKRIFAKEVPCSNIAYHSRYIADAGPGLLKYLSEVIKEPKPRSERWVSTSVPRDKWDEPAAKFSSAEYHTNNLLNPVLFEEASQLIPPNAVLVEIAPHGLLQAILKRSLPISCKYFPLTRRGHPDNPFLVLDAVGKLFMEGYNPRVEVLYPKVEFPVSTGTPFLSHLVQWAHNEKWNLPLYSSACRKIAAACTFIITVHDDEYEYLRGSIVRGKNVYPFAAGLVAVWDTLAMANGVKKKELSVEFTDVNFYVQPVINHQVPLKINVALHRGTGKFEIMDGRSTVATGYIEAISKETSPTSKKENLDEDMIYNSEDIYQILCEREYSYKESFQSIRGANKTFSKGYIDCNDNWVTLIDGLLQMNMLRREHDAVSQVTHVRNLQIDVRQHLAADKVDYNGKTVIEASVCDLHDITRCGGIAVQNMKFADLQPSHSNKVTLKTLQFVPRFQSEIMDAKLAIQIFIQIVAENTNKNEINIVELVSDSQDHELFDFDLDDIPGLTVKYKFLYSKEFLQMHHENDDVDLTILKSCSTNKKLIAKILPAETFIVTFENNEESQVTWPTPKCRVVSSYNTGDMRLSLARWKPLPTPTLTQTVTVLSTTDLALLLSKRESLSLDQKLLIITSYPPIDGMKELIAQWRTLRPNRVFVVMVNHKIAKDQSDVQVPDFELAFNVLQHGSWGGVYYVPFLNKPPHDKRSNVSLSIERIGDLGSIKWIETLETNTQRQRVMIHYAGLNFTDAQKATGVYPSWNKTSSTSFGMDYSGVTESGEQVMGIVERGSCSRWVRAIPELTWPVPKYWTLEEAATVPLAYAQAFYCLGIKVLLAGNSSILVHGGAGALGQATVSICLAFGLQVFVTVGDERKKAFLMRLFPDLKEDHIGCSRDYTFGDMVKRLTKGWGVLYVLNCLPGDLRNVSMKCVKNNGVLLDTVQISSNEDYFFGMYQLNSARHYMTVDFSSIFNNHSEMKKIQLLISEGIRHGYVRPLSRVTLAPGEAARALRLLAASRHRGRVLLRLADDHTPAMPRIICSPTKTHLLVCDDEYAGLQIADQLLSRGVRKLFLNLPKIPAIGAKHKLSWENCGVEVKVSAINLTENKGFHLLLKECTNVAPVEGIYYVSLVNSKTNREVLTAFDVMSRKLCTSLRYFAVMSTDKSLGNRICITRMQDHLPATKLTIPTVKINTNVGKYWQNALDMLEIAVRSSVPVIYVHLDKQKKISLLEKIAAACDIAVPENKLTSASLKEIGISEEKALAIGVLLREEQNVFLTVEDILSLSIQQIQDMDQTSEGIAVKEVRGLDVFFSYVDSDELMATTETVFMSTLTSGASMRDDEVDMSQTNLCIVPGLEGNCERFREFCERIKMPALVLQPGLDYPNESIQELAERYSKTLLKRISLEKDFYLLGYECGVMVALEIAAILEDHGLQGTVFCIGGAPEEVKELLEDELHEFPSEEALQDAVIRHMFQLMVGSSCELQFDDLPWREKVEQCVRALRGRAPLSGQYARAQFAAAYGRIAQARRYRPTPRALRSRLVLLRASGYGGSENRASSSQPSQHQLQQYSQQPASVHELPSAPAHILRDLRCASIVNRHLCSMLLQDFGATNLCETYLMNADTFMSSQSLNDTS